MWTLRPKYQPIGNKTPICSQRSQCSQPQKQGLTTLSKSHNPMSCMGLLCFVVNVVNTILKIKYREYREYVDTTHRIKPQGIVKLRKSLTTLTTNDLTPIIYGGCV